MICLYCGETIPDESIFCTKCGRQLVVQTAAPVEEIPAAAEPEAAEGFSAVAEPTVTGAFPAAVEPAAAEVFSATEAVPPAEILPEEEIPPAEILPEEEEFPPAEPTGPQCPFCGAALREQAVFCTKCGRRVPVPEKAPEAIPFVGMSQELPKAAVLTGISAEKAAPAVILPEAETGEEEIPATMIIPEEEETLPAEMIPEEEVPPAVILPEVEETPPAEPTGPRCPFCGAALREQAVFCTNCGRRVPVPEKAPEAIPFVGMSRELPKAANLTGISAEKAAPAQGLSKNPVPTEKPAPAKAPKNKKGVSKEKSAPKKAPKKSPKEPKKEKTRNTGKILLVSAAILLLAAGIGFGVMKLLERKEGGGDQPGTRETIFDWGQASGTSAGAQESGAQQPADTLVPETEAAPGQESQTPAETQPETPAETQPQTTAEPTRESESPASGGIQILLQPQDTQASQGGKASFSVEAEGEGLRYEWQYSRDRKVWSSMESFTNTLKVDAKSARNGYWFRCKIQDEYGNLLYSEVAQLTVLAAEATEPATEEATEPSTEAEPPVTTQPLLAVVDNELVVTLKYDEIEEGTMVTFGTYEQDNKPDKKEPIEWIIYYKGKTHVYLISRYILDAVPFSYSSNPTIFTDSNLDLWLEGRSGSFYETAFTSLEKKLLGLQELEVPKNEMHKETRQAGFLYRTVANFSLDELKEYMSPDFYQAAGTPYAISRGLSVRNGFSPWWSRTMGRDGSYAGYVSYQGKLNYDGCLITAADVGVRPVIAIANETFE